MFVPLHDANGLEHIRLQYVTIGLIAANVIVFLLTGFGSEQAQIATVYGLGYIPSVAFDTVELPPELYYVPEDFTYLTYAFLHADMFHLGGNMLFLWVFGDNIEDALGHIRFLIFYLLCAIGGAAFHGFLDPASQVPLIGASGAVAGVVSAYLLLHPRVKIWVLAFGRIPLRIPAWIALTLWIGFQVVMFAAGGEQQVSWACHIGGILTGAILVVLLKRRAVPLFDREVVTPLAVEVEQKSAVRPPEGKPAPRWGRQ
ncbi:rhomboid family intramembrane serine protease [Kumtagia ephedrae]|uniref:Rhomboid family intramembrane serine protease n=1 Tax=Kumtagia ephedrae TaxID=2116701 RepID=A0A2P7RIS6_9HYPH|nr:rhomboid family intramembrane serine protease [Mesorhizobium ephedrae]PSJ50134.1 rhomboid family intramembrane serine protease [Mesorhizobium ephedrae]